MTIIKSKLFEDELNLIVNEDLRMAVKSYLEEDVGEWFWEEGASASGKYHPEFSQGIGGLVRHTKAVVMFAQELLRMNTYAYMKEEYKDFVIAACIVHDTRKYGGMEFDKSCYKEHGKLAAAAFKQWCIDNHYDIPGMDFLYSAIASHMGQWTPNKEDRPFTNIDRCVHMADYIASRPFIDIPCITDEYMDKVGEAWESDDEDNDDLPF